jgi:hypothetical protein
MSQDDGSVVRAENSGAMTLFKEFIRSNQLTQEHITKILGIGERIVEARIQAGLAESMTTNRIRLIMADLSVDSLRCERAADYLERFAAALSNEEMGLLVTHIIKKQLGVL